MTEEAGNSGGIITKSSPSTVPDTVARFSELLDQRGVRRFMTIDQRAEAATVGLELRETTVVLFGNPAAGTPVMAVAPYAALDLPLKIVVWDDEGDTKVSYQSPQSLADRYGLAPDLAAGLAAIDHLTDALTAQ